MIAGTVNLCLAQKDGTWKALTIDIRSTPDRINWAMDPVCMGGSLTLTNVGGYGYDLRACFADIYRELRELFPELEAWEYERDPVGRWKEEPATKQHGEEG